MPMKKLAMILLFNLSFASLAVSDEAANWSGWHVGLGTGKAKAQTGYSYYVPPGGFFPNGLDENYNFKTNQNIFSLHLGYDHQFGNFVAGLEGTLNTRTGKSKPWDWAAIALPAPIAYYSSEQEIKARLGYLVHPDWLIFASAGAAHTNLKFNFINEDELISPDAVYSPLQGKRWGWSVGAGVDVKIVENISMRLEFSHTDYGKEPIGGFVLIQGTKRDYHLEDQMLTLSFQYHF